jgi:hypothetical protein
MGPITLYSVGNLIFDQESVLLLFSMNVPYINTPESSILGPYDQEDKVLFVYNRCVNNPDAQDERLRIMGTDCWIVIATPKKNEVVLKSKIDIVKMILDIEFENITEISELSVDIALRSSQAIRTLYKS